LRIAGVRVGLALQPDLTPTSVGLYFAVGDLDAARADVERAGGKIGAPVEVAPGVFVAEVTDTEGNTLSLRRN
jgi:predicted enzyme related to lactoylglutathione lyase